MQNSQNGAVVALPAAALESLPESLRAAVQVQWHDFLAAVGESVALDEPLLAALTKVWGSSDFVARTCVRYPALCWSWYRAVSCGGVTLQGITALHWRQR